MNTKKIRIAWLFPSLALGNYWHPVLSEFTKIYPQTTVFTGEWPGYSPGFEKTFTVKVVDRMKFIETVRSETGYSRGFIRLSLKIVVELLRFQPDIIFTTGFSIWSFLSLLLKPMGRWQVIIAYEGSSPAVDYRDSPVRLFLRRLMTRFTDAFITNSITGKNYLIECLKVPERLVFSRPYQVPDVTALVEGTQENNSIFRQFQQPIFLFTGQTIPRKGLSQLLKACKLLQERGYRNYTLLIVGDGNQKDELQEFCKLQDLEKSVHWLGWINYRQLGAYFKNADIFIFPTLEDTWGMAILEAMAFGKPILCSKWAGASEIIIDRSNGYLFDPHQTQEIADAMQNLIEQPKLIPLMAKRSQELIAGHTPIDAALFLAKVTNTVVARKS